MPEDEQTIFQTHFVPFVLLCFFVALFVAKNNG